MNDDERTTAGASGRSVMPMLAALWAFALVGVAAMPAVADDTTADWSLRAQLGLEYDDNPLRREGHDHSGDGLARYLIGGDIVTDHDRSRQVSVSVQHGATRFWRQSEANAMVTGADVAASWNPDSPLYVQGRADLKDRIETAQRRDYIRGGAAGRLGASLGDIRLWVDGGARFFAFKPSASSSYAGPQMRAGANWTARDDLSVGASLRRAWRSYSTTAWQLRDDRFVPVGDGIERADVYDALRFQLRLRRRVQGRLRYQYAANDSNSYGQRLRRHRLEAALTVPVVWDTFLSARLEVQHTSYEDPVAIDEVFLIDEEQRNTAIAALRRTIAGPWEVELRYSLYTGEFGVGDNYLRQTLALSVGVVVDD